MKLKITCRTPKNKADQCMKSFGLKYFSGTKKPIETKKLNHDLFYYIYEYEKEKDMYKVIHKKIPKAENAIRGFYTIIISLAERANKLGKKGAWTVEKIKRWIMRRMKKKGYAENEVKEFVDAIDLEDKDYMLGFLGQKLFEWEVIEDA